MTPSPDSPLAAAIRHNTQTPNGRDGDELSRLILDKMRRTFADRPWLLEPDTFPQR